MIENQVSRSALMAAYIRAYHSLHDEPKIFDDFLAHLIMPEERQEFIEQGLVNSLQFIDPERTKLCPDKSTALAWLVQTVLPSSIMLSRARYTENRLKQAVKQGIRQYVILGAGMDTFAFRQPEMLDQLHIYEVDHPATQTYKIHRLVELGWEAPTQLHFVPVDFTQDSLAAALTHSSYNPQVKSFFSWLGVTYYLPRDAVFATFRTIAGIAPAGSTVIFDYLDTDAFIPEKAAKYMQIWLDNVRRAGEPLKSGYDPSMIAADLEDQGLRLHENLSPAEIEKRYFHGRMDQYHALEHANLACAVVK